MLVVSNSRKITFLFQMLFKSIYRLTEFPTHLMETACKVTDANGWENERQLKKKT